LIKSPLAFERKWRAVAHPEAVADLFRSDTQGLEENK